MSLSEKSTRGSKTPTSSTPAPPGDHRKRRRNRTTQSCLNCHASKRMCDRRRPACQRCTTLGLTGLCVYEVDDPSQRNTHSDEKALLRSRVAELEGVIREMKNKPHPRWSQKSGTSQAPSPQSSDDDCILPLITTDDCSNEGYGDIRTTDEALSQTSGTTQLKAPSIHLTPVSPSPGTPLACESPLTPQDPHFLTAFNLPSPPNSSSSSSPASIHRTLPRIVINEARPLGAPDFAVDRLLASTSLEPTGFEEGIYGHMLDHMMRTDQARTASLCGCDSSSSARERTTCGCIDNASVYNSLLELSVRLRKAVESLGPGRVAEHRTRGYDPGCQLYAKICELDKLTSSTLGNAMSPAERNPTSDTYFTPLSAEFMPSTISPHCLSNIQQWESSVVRPSISGTPDEDSFMSWDNASRESWVQGTRS